MSPLLLACAFCAAPVRQFESAAFAFSARPGRVSLENKMTGGKWSSEIGLGRVVLANGKVLSVGTDEAAWAAAGLHAEASLQEPGRRFFVRGSLVITAAGHDVAVKRIELAGLNGLKAVGTTYGSPLASDGVYASAEDPMARTENGVSYLERKLPIPAGQSITFSFVYGVTRKGQLRRDFQQYLEAERPRKYSPFLHYNSWYDIGYFDRYTADQCVERIHAFGDELTKKRGVKISSFLFDDGWDDPNTVWEFTKSFPEQFLPVTAAAKEYGAEPGAWLSPWGGYGKPRAERLAAGKAAGYEIDSQGYALSGPKYYDLFRKVTLDMVTRQGINQFKFDGTGSPDKQYPGSRFDSDFSAAISLIADLRKAKPSLFINLTTGTWPSPFWTRYADSIWRGGSDHSFAGEGSWRQKWITYRDGDTYHGVVQKGPLYPINSLMLHGLIYAQHAQHLGDDPNHDFGDEVKSYFATGTQLQEMYITPTLLSKQDWDTLGMAANWSQAHKAELRDAHWVGGDPLAGEVYGWAGWANGKGYLALRNPTPRQQSFSIENSRVFELMSDSRVTYGPTLNTPASSMSIEKGKARVVTLMPFQVLAWEAQLPR